MADRSSEGSVGTPPTIPLDRRIPQQELSDQTRLRQGGTTVSSSSPSGRANNASVDNLAVNQDRLAGTISVDSTDPEDFEDQLLDTASSPREAPQAAVSPDVNMEDQETESAGAVAADRGSSNNYDDTPSKGDHPSIQLSMQKGESFSAMSASSPLDGSGQTRGDSTPEAPDSRNIGPPTTIIEQPPDDDTDSSFIKLDSMKEEEEGSARMSDVSDFHMTSSANGSNATNLLNLDSSSGTSMGSQGSYAYQVPALSKSASASNRTGGSQNIQQTANRIGPHPRYSARDINLARGSVVLPPRSTEGLMMMNPPSVSANSAATSMPLDVGDVPHNSDLDDILGPKGEPMNSDLDDILGPPCSHASDLDETLGPYQATDSNAPTTVPSSDSAQEGNSLTNYASKYTTQLPDTTTQARRFRPKGGASTGGMVDPNGYEEPSPTTTPGGSEPGTPTNHTPTLSREAIDHIGRALAERDAGRRVISPSAETGASILPEPSVVQGGSTAYGTAMDYRTTRLGKYVASPQSSVSSKNQSRQSTFPRQAESVDSVEPASTWESRNNWAASASREAFARRDEEDLSTHEGDMVSAVGQSSSWASSRGETLSPGASSQADTLSPNASEGRSPSSRGTHTLSPSTRATTQALSSTLSSQNGSFESSQQGTVSAREDSTTGGDSLVSRVVSSGSGSQSEDYSSHGDTMSPSERSRDDECSFTEHTRTAESSQVESFDRAEQFSPATSEDTQESIHRFTFDSKERKTLRAKNKRAIQVSRSTSEGANYSEESPPRVGTVETDGSIKNTDFDDGDIPWDAVQTDTNNDNSNPASPQTQKFAESIMARTRSRADPDALVDNGSSIGGDAMETPTRSMIKLSTQEDANIIESTALARKRVRVVQLLGAGLTTFLVSLMGGFWIQSSCHFVSTKVEVGENGQVYSLRFGLWKFSPIDSVFQGYSYCTPYNDDYLNDGPWVSRLTSNLALIGGAFSLIVLWIYLVFGRCNHRLWKGAVITAALSGFLQLATLSIFAGPVCTKGCMLGPGGYVSILAGCFYLFLAYEMHYNAPLATVVDGLLVAVTSGEHPQNLMADLEMKDFKYGAKAYVRRLTLGDTNPYPTLNQVQRENGSPMAGQLMERDLSKSGSYQPPPVLV